MSSTAQKENMSQQQQPRKSLRAIAGQRFKEQYNAKSYKSNNKIPQDKQKQLQEVFRQYDSGQITKNQFQNKIQNDMQLKTNDMLERNLKQIHVNYGHVLQGIEKDQNEEIRNLKPTNVLKQQLENPDKSISLLKYQDIRTDDLKHDTQNEHQKKTIENINHLLEGKINQKQFISNLQEQGLDTREIEINMREFNSANATDQSKLGAKIYRAVDQKLQKDDEKLVCLQNCGVSPNRAQRLPYKPNNDLGYYNPEQIHDYDQIDNHQIQTELRIINDGRVYNEKKGHGYCSRQGLDNGDIFQWKGKSKIVDSPVKQRVVSNQTQKSTLNLKLEETKNQPYQENVKPKNLNQLASQKDLFTHTAKPVVEQKPKKVLTQFLSSANVISWN